MPTALIADDEPLLAAALQSALSRLWPQLEILAVVHDGASALAEINRLRPDIAFLDIRMPGLDGMAVARSVSGCRVVFVTAYDEYALQAFDAAALDYLLKPIDDARLLRCISRLQQAAPLVQPIAAAPAEAQPAYLSWITAGLGNSKRLIAVDEVQYFKACDKYTELVLAGETQLIRTPLKELAARLDPRQFAQIHRGLIVRLAAVQGIEQDLLGRSFVPVETRRRQAAAEPQLRRAVQGHVGRKPAWRAFRRCPGGRLDARQAAWRCGVAALSGRPAAPSIRRRGWR